VTKLTIAIPVYNERRLLPQLLARLDGVLPEVAKEVILVDDGSSDGTREWIVGHIGSDERFWTGMRVAADGEPAPILASHHGAGVPVTLAAILHERNRGKGAALRTALKRARGDVIVIQDADLEYDPRDLVELWRVIAEGHADVVFGSRFYGRPHRCLYYHHYLGNRLISLLFSLLYNQILTDLEAGYKMFRREVLPFLSLECDDFGFEIEFSANVARAGSLRLYEVGIAYYGRTYAEGKKIDWRDGLKALWYLLRFRMGGNRVSQA